MKEIYITEKELEYLTDIPQMVCEGPITAKPRMSFEQASKDCITLEEFSRRWDESIRRLIPNL